ncbi:hypothetical protein C8Q78DRAFT_930355, partial [Trametes maxima]
MWLKAYLDITVRRPTWAKVADILIAKAAASTRPKTGIDTRINTFTQNWDVSARRAKGLPEDLRRMIMTAKKYGVCCETRNPGLEIRNELPVWHHLQEKAGRSTANSEASICLRERHGVTTVIQCLRIAQRLENGENNHRKNNKCKCYECDRDRRTMGCLNPHRCVIAARKMIAKIKMKWNPEGRANDDGLTLTRRRKEANKRAEENKGRIIFDPSMKQEGPIANALRVFVKDRDKLQTAALRPRKSYGVEGEEVEVFTDGSCVKNGLDGASAGSGIWFGDGDARNASERVPYETQTNQVAEIHAITMAGEKVPPFAPLHIVSD